MRKTAILTISILALTGLGACSNNASESQHTQDVAVHEHAHEESKFNYMPKDGYKPTVAAKFVPASADNILGENERVADIFKAAVEGKTLVQRLTENSYWVFVGNYNTTFYVGKEGVLLLDPLGADTSGAVLEAIKSVTDKPVTTILYSHNHADHIGGIQTFVDEAAKNGQTLNIIASDKTVEKQVFLKSALPKPTTVLSAANDTTTFEDITLQYVPFNHTAHTDDSASWLIVSEGILHVPDLVNPDQMPFLSFGGSENFVYLKQNLETMQGLDWDILSSGHGNVGRKSDIAFNIAYADDLVAATEEASEQVDWEAVFAAEPNNHATLVFEAGQQRDKLAMDILRPKYGAYYGFEVSAPSHVNMVAAALESYK